MSDFPDPEPQPTPDLPPMCGRCYDASELFLASCAHKPEATHGAIGMYHCPDCGAMVLAGMEHPPLCRPCNERRHPYFD